MTPAKGKNSQYSRSQATISTYFTPNNSPVKAHTKKRTASPIDLTIDDDDNIDSPKAKKPKTSKWSYAPEVHREASVGAGPSHVHPNVTSTLEARQSSSPLRQSPPIPAKTRGPLDEAARKNRREAFKKRLLGENSSFIRRTSSIDGGSRAMDVEEDDQSKNQETEHMDRFGDESDEAFNGLRKMFSNPQAKEKITRKGQRKGKAPAATNAKKRPEVEEATPSGQEYTPLEKQVLKFKAENPGTLLMIEVGYKYRFFGDDAKVAAKELGMACFPDRNFIVASIPTFRRDIYLRKLLSQGYRVGIVNQVETAALKKASENRNELFNRRLTHLYTATTYVDEMDSVDNLERYNPPPLMCLAEEQRGGMGADDRVRIGMITICPSSGDIVWDEFDDSYMRTELETRMVHTKPAELLLPEDGLTKPSERMLAHFTGVSVAGDKIRIERFRGLMDYSDAFSFISDFYTEKTKSRVASADFYPGKLMAAVTGFPKLVVVVLAHAIKHLQRFNIADAFVETKFFHKFTTRVHMLLNGNTLTNLEIYRNGTDYSVKGSLMWILDHTKTKFGARMLRSWVGRPLIDMAVLNDRVDAVEELRSSSSEKLATLRGLLKDLPDLATGLSRIQYGKCTPKELSTLLSAFNKIANAFEPCTSPADIGFTSKLLNDIIFSLPNLRSSMKKLLSIISLKHAAEGRKDTMWNDPERYPVIADIDMAIQAITLELNDELKSIRKLLKMPALKWTSVLGDDYLIELNKRDKHVIPDNWLIASRTKNTERYCTPEVKKKVQERDRYTEALEAESRKAFLHFLDEIAQDHYGVMRDAVDKLAMADCLISLALVSLQGNYVRPEFTEEDVLEIEDGRHPMVEALSSDPFVPISVRIGAHHARSKIITGPNMGGKSSTVRMIALVALMAQIGSYVPATSVKLGMQDAILTRMGASDELARGRSTFMVEMSETSDILQTATPRSLVILDELGRGTSTFDGMAIADAVLDHLVSSVKCKTLFITHYPLVAEALEKKHPADIQNLHMGFREESHIDGTREITFLYRLTHGMATESFGIECARLAGLPEKLLEVAAKRSQSFQAAVQERVKQNKVRKCAEVLNKCLTATNLEAAAAFHELQALVDSMSTLGLSTRNI